MNIILNNPNPSDQEILIADINSDGLINVIDVVMLVGFILNP